MESVCLASATAVSPGTTKSEPTVQPHSDETTDPRSDLQLHFMRMMEAHDRVRARLLGSSHGESYAVLGD
jgi:hypothetical protein